MAVRKASANWRGGLKDGTGTLATSSGVLSQVPYSFGRRFENDPGTNPEELVGAAHAGCFAMALSGNLGKRGFTADNIDASAHVTLELKDGKQTVTKIHLDVTAKVPNITPEAFAEAAAETKTGCPISRLLNAEITLDAKLA
jgi:lipoyl-dependent peroxiredoxin